MKPSARGAPANEPDPLRSATSEARAPMAPAASPEPTSEAAASSLPTMSAVREPEPTRLATAETTSARPAKMTSPAPSRSASAFRPSAPDAASEPLPRISYREDMPPAVRGSDQLAGDSAPSGRPALSLLRAWNRLDVWPGVEKLLRSEDAIVPDRNLPGDFRRTERLPIRAIRTSRTPGAQTGAWPPGCWRRPASARPGTRRRRPWACS